MKYFEVYSRMYTLTKIDNKRYLPKDSYTLLEPIREWYDMDMGLAKYLDEDLKEKVRYIHYQCTRDGYVEFEVELNSLYDSNDVVTYRGEELTLKTAICKYIEGQISDGWGGNGIYVLQGWIGRLPKIVNLTWELYEKDYEKSMELAEKAGRHHAPFDEFPAYKEI